jgi:hypothetical protein
VDPGLDADTERVVTLLNGLTGLAESGLREKVAAMPADERARLGALASEILDDAPPAHPRRERMSDRELDNAIIAALGVQRAEYRAGHSAIRSVVA